MGAENDENVLVEGEAVMDESRAYTQNVRDEAGRSVVVVGLFDEVGTQHD